MDQDDELDNLFQNKRMITQLLASHEEIMNSDNMGPHTKEMFEKMILMLTDELTQTDIKIDLITEGKQDEGN